METEEAQVAVLDASVVLAAFKNETPSGPIIALMERSVISAVNLSEIFTKASEIGLSESPSLKRLLAYIKAVEPFTADHAYTAATLRGTTRQYGLSFGDRACLALALHLNADVYTMDRSWANVQIGCTIHQMR